MDKIRKGDEVIVIAGKDKGKRGTVLRRVDAEHVVVEGVNRAKKHVKPNPVKGVVGGIVEKTCRSMSPMLLSTTMLPARRTELASRCLKTARRFVFSSRAASL